MMKHKHTPLYAAVAAALVPLTQSPVSLAQLPEPIIEEVIVTGTRAPGRSAEDLPVPPKRSTRISGYSIQPCGTPEQQAEMLREAAAAAAVEAAAAAAAS